MKWVKGATVIFDGSETGILVQTNPHKSVVDVAGEMETIDTDSITGYYTKKPIKISDSAVKHEFEYTNENALINTLVSLFGGHFDQDLANKVYEYLEELDLEGSKVVFVLSTEPGKSRTLVTEPLKISSNRYLNIIKS